MKLGVQLFGSMRLYNEDPEGYLAKIKEMGYDEIEPCLMFGGNAPIAWDASKIEEYAKRTQAHGLSISSAHAFAKDFSAATDDMRKAAKKTGIKSFVVGLRGDLGREALAGFANRCISTADALAADGLELWLHNNAAEIAAKIDGLSAYEYVLRACGGRLGAQVDTGWVVCGGEDLAKFLERNAEFIRSIHHKDISSLTDENGRTPNVALGAGIVDPKLSYSFAIERGLGQIVDQDNSAGDFMQDLLVSAKYLRSLGSI